MPWRLSKNHSKCSMSLGSLLVLVLTPRSAEVTPWKLQVISRHGKQLNCSKGVAARSGSPQNRHSVGKPSFSEFLWNSGGGGSSNWTQ